jgi:hypothetical protein
MLGSGQTDPMPLDLTDDEKVALIELLRDTIERSRFLLSPQISKLRAIYTKLVAEPPRPEPYPAPKPSARPSAVLAKRRNPRR